MKNTPQDFAVLGGIPEFTDPLTVGAPNLPDEEELIRRIRNVFASGQLTNNGPVVQEFERRIALELEVRNCICVCNGTMALQVMAAACDLKGEVIVPSLTFVATAHALNWIGLTPVFADVDPVSHTLDPDSVRTCISDRTSAILGVHLWGNPCRLTELQTLADEHELTLLYDASHAFCCRSAGVPIGNFGDAEAFSFHATKVMHSIEGGAIVTNDDALAAKCRLLRNFGITGLTETDGHGINGKLNEVCAAAGLASLDSIDSVIAQNQQNMQDYYSTVEGIPGFIPAINLRDLTDRNAHYVVMRVDSEFGISRDQLVSVLRAEGVLVRSYFAPGCHKCEPYVRNPVHCPASLTVTDNLVNSLIQFPTGSQISQRQIERIGALIRDIRRHRFELARHLGHMGGGNQAGAPGPESGKAA